MSPTDLLAREHRLIEQVLNCLERMMDRSAAEGRLQAESAREIVRFLREYAEGIHLDPVHLASLRHAWRTDSMKTQAPITTVIGLRARLNGCLTCLYATMQDSASSESAPRNMQFATEHWISSVALRARVTARIIFVGDPGAGAHDSLREKGRGSSNSSRSRNPRVPSLFSARKPLRIPPLPPSGQPRSSCACTPWGR